MKRTRSPRSTRCRATASSGVTWPWMGTLAMMIEDMGSASVGRVALWCGVDWYGVVLTSMEPQSNDFSAALSSRSPRAYRSELRQRQARETKLRVVAVAADLFAELGYARTTLAKIAEAAGVSVETVQAQGSKAALMIASVEFAAFGVTGDHSVLDLDIGRRFVAIIDCDEAVDFMVAEQTAVHQRAARTTRALYGAAA